MKKVKRFLLMLVIKLTYVLICLMLIHGAGHLWWEAVERDLPDAQLLLQRLADEDPRDVLRQAWDDRWEAR